MRTLLGWPARSRLLRVAHLAAIVLLLSITRPAHAQQTATPKIYTPPSKYLYHGCYNETTALEGTAKDRALDGASLVSPGNMTAQMCLDFCRLGSTVYKFAGLEFSRECWCGQHLSTLSAKFPDSECNTACDGDNTTICGGSMKLSVYISGGRPSLAHGPGVLALMIMAGIASLSAEIF